MARTVNVNEFLDLNGVIIDVRSESEFAHGHIEGAFNIPLFSDDQRAEVGTIYVKKSREEAVERGLQIVGPKMYNFVKSAKQIANGQLIKIYCWRGGMRSGSMQWLFEMAGLKTVRLEGGYKAYRGEFDVLLDKGWTFNVIAGETGSGKSEILSAMSSLGCQVIDLEGLANHKGSAFGALGQEKQPTTEEFINRIFHVMRKFDARKPIWVEGESMLIGRVFIPEKLFKMLNVALTVHFTLDRQKRLDRIMSEYGHFEVEQLKNAFERIKKRLGYDNYKFAIDFLDAGEVRKAADLALIYYDKGYLKSIEKREPVNLVHVYSDIDDAQVNALKIMELCK